MKKMLIDATQAEEIRVATMDGQWLEDLDFELSSRKSLKGNIYLAKVMRVEPSLQAAFVDYGGNRHGFLSFTEIHQDYYRIPVSDRSRQDALANQDHLAGQTTDTDETTDMSHVGSPYINPGAETEQDNPEIENQELPDHPSSENLAAGAPLAAPPKFDPWAEQPGSGSLADLLPEFANQPGPVTDFTAMPPVMAEATAEMPTTEAAPAQAAPERRERQWRPRYKIQEVIKRGQVMLVQVVKDERGSKGAALTTHLSLAGRYCVLMPNSESGGGVSRKITDFDERRRMKELLDQLDVPEGMGVILRTAGMEQSAPEIQRDLDFLLRLWNNIREQTLASNAPAMIYEEANLIKRSLRDLFSPEVDEVQVAGEKAYELARLFMTNLVPEQLDKVRLYTDSVPIFSRYNVERQIDNLHSPVVQLRSGGYIVISPTEALVAIDVNSGRSTRERHIEETAYRTNLEAAQEIARQLRLRDLAGLIVIDFIDMEDSRNNLNVERRFKESMRYDRARVQIGRISHFGLLELSRQRLRPSLLETHFEKCSTCGGSGYVRAPESAALAVLRMLEDEGLKQGAGDISVQLPPKVALYLLNNKRHLLTDIERRYDLHLTFIEADVLDYVITRERSRQAGSARLAGPAVNMDDVLAESAAESLSGTAYARHEDIGEFPVSNETSGERRRGRQHEHGEERPEGSRDNFREGHERGRGRGRGRDRDRDRGGRGGHRQPQAEAAPLQPVDGEPLQPVTSFDHPSQEPLSADQGERGPRPEGAEGERGGRRRRGRRGGRRQQGQNREDNWQEQRRRRFGEGQPGSSGTGQAMGELMSGPAPSAPVTPSATPSYAAPAAANVTPMARNNPSPAYSVISEPPEKPRMGWWQKLTGQK